MIPSVVWRVARIVVSVALLAYVISGSDWQTLGSLLSAPWLIVCIVTLPVIGASVESFRLGVLYDALGMSLPFRTGFRVVSMATFFNFCIPGATGGDVVKIWYLNAVARRHPAEVAAIWFVDRLTGVFSLLLLVVAVGLLNLPFIGAHSLLGWLLAGAIGMIVALGILTTVACLDLGGVFDRLLARYPRIRQFVARIEESIAAFRRRPGALVQAVGISLIGHVALLATFIALGQYFMPAVAPRLVGLLSIFGLFANALPITPGGLGVGEAAFDTLFHIAGATSGPALILAWRIGMMPLCLCGWVLYMTGLKGRRASADANASNPAAVALR